MLVNLEEEWDFTIASGKRLGKTSARVATNFEDPLF